MVRMWCHSAVCFVKSILLTHLFCFTLVVEWKEDLFPCLALGEFCFSRICNALDERFDKRLSIESSSSHPHQLS